MTASSAPPPPGERRLDRPPSDRYRDDAAGRGAASSDGATSPPSGARALAVGTLVGLAGAGATVILGGLLGMSAGLLVVAGATGWAVGASLKASAAGTTRPAPRPVLAVGIAVVAVALGQLGLWLYAGSEGGVLSLPDYLGATFGPLVPAQVVLAALLAWWSAR